MHSALPQPLTCNGIVLIEVLLATLVVAMSAVTSVRAATESIGLAAELGNQQIALRLSGDIYESISTVPVDQLRDLPAPANHACGLAEACTTRVWLAGQLLNWQQHASDSLPNGSVVLVSAADQVRIEIGWQARNGQTHSYALHYVLA